MHKILKPLAKTKLEGLISLRESVNMVSACTHRRRIGVNKFNKLSVYDYSRYMSWTHTQRQLFSKFFPKKADDVAVVKWFVEFPPYTGFLDRLESWTTDPSPSWVTSYCIRGNGHVIINDEHVYAEQGQGLCFPLSAPHEVPPTEHGSTWAFVLTCDNVW